MSKTTQEVADKTYKAHANDGTGLALNPKAVAPVATTAAPVAPKKKVPFKEKMRAAGQQAKEKLKAVGQKVKEDPKAVTDILRKTMAAPPKKEGPPEDKPSYALEVDESPSLAELFDYYGA